MSDEEFKRILANIPKQKTPNKIPLQSPYVHSFYSPTPKTTNSKRTIGLPRFFLTDSNSHSKDVLLQTNHMFDLQGRRQLLDKLLAGAQKDIWQTALSNKLERLVQGVRDTKGNDVIDFIHFSQVPVGRIITYVNMVCDIRPLKTEK